MPVINGKYYTEEEIDAIKRESKSDEEFEKFLISGVIGAVTGSSLIGGLLGGSLLGGLAGDMLEGDDDSWF
jgi:hypothetical protein